MDFVEILKLVFLVIGIIGVGAFIIWGLVTLILKIIEPHGTGTTVKNEYVNNQITYEKYEPVKLVEDTKVAQEVKNETEEEDEVSDVDLDKAREEEEALNNASPFESLEAEEEEFIKTKQKNIEERLANKDEDVNVDDIFVDDEQEDNDDEDEDNDNDNEEAEEDDIEALINKILDGEDEDNEESSDSENVEEGEQVEEAEEVSEDEVADDEAEEVESEEEQEDTADNAESDDDDDNDAEGRIKALEEALARQKEEYENKIKALEEEKADEEKVAPVGSIEEYEARIEVLKERLKANEKELKKVKKDFIPLYKIHKTLERDNIKLRRKEALVAKQKVVLYGVNNYVDIDEEKAKKLSEDLDLLEGLRLSVQHCEEVMKDNEDRYPILENSYNSLLETNKNIKADIEDYTAKIEELKAAEDNDNE